MKKKENKTVVFLNAKLYSLGAIYGASYVFLDKAYIYLEEAPKAKVKVTLKGKNRLSQKSLDGLKDEFLNELLNASLREHISKNNQKIREYIVAKALASASVRPPQGAFPQTGSFGRKEPIRDDADLIIPWTGEKIGKRPEKQGNPLWVKDPLGIAVPWEEKYAKKKQKARKRER